MTTVRDRREIHDGALNQLRAGVVEENARFDAGVYHEHMTWLREIVPALKSRSSKNGVATNENVDEAPSDNVPQTPSRGKGRVFQDVPSGASASLLPETPSALRAARRQRDALAQRASSQQGRLSTIGGNTTMSLLPNPSETEVSTLYSRHEAVKLSHVESKPAKLTSETESSRSAPLRQNLRRSSMLRKQADSGATRKSSRLQQTRIEAAELKEHKEATSSLPGANTTMADESMVDLNITNLGAEQKHSASQVATSTHASLFQYSSQAGKRDAPAPRRRSRQSLASDLSVTSVSIMDGTSVNASMNTSMSQGSRRSKRLQTRRSAVQDQANTSTSTVSSASAAEDDSKEETPAQEVEMADSTASVDADVDMTSQVTNDVEHTPLDEESAIVPTPEVVEDLESIVVAEIEEAPVETRPSAQRTQRSTRQSTRQSVRLRRSTRLSTKPAPTEDDASDDDVAQPVQEVAEVAVAVDVAEQAEVKFDVVVPVSYFREIHVEEIKQVVQEVASDNTVVQKAEARPSRAVTRKSTRQSTKVTQPRRSTRLTQAPEIVEDEEVEDAEAPAAVEIVTEATAHVQPESDVLATRKRKSDESDKPSEDTEENQPAAKVARVTSEAPKKRAQSIATRKSVRRSTRARASTFAIPESNEGDNDEKEADQANSTAVAPPTAVEVEVEVTAVVVEEIVPVDDRDSDVIRPLDSEVKDEPIESIESPLEDATPVESRPIVANSPLPLAKEAKQATPKAAPKTVPGDIPRTPSVKNLSSLFQNRIDTHEKQQRMDRPTPKATPKRVLAKPSAPDSTPRKRVLHTVGDDDVLNLSQDSQNAGDDETKPIQVVSNSLANRLNRPVAAAPPGQHPAQLSAREMLRRLREKVTQASTSVPVVAAEPFESASSMPGKRRSDEMDTVDDEAKESALKKQRTDDHSEIVLERKRAQDLAIAEENRLKLKMKEERQARIQAEAAEKKRLDLEERRRAFQEKIERQRKELQRQQELAEERKRVEAERRAQAVEEAERKRLQEEEEDRIERERQRQEEERRQQEVIAKQRADQERRAREERELQEREREQMRQFNEPAQKAMAPPSFKSPLRAQPANVFSGIVADLRMAQRGTLSLDEVNHHTQAAVRALAEQHSERFSLFALTLARAGWTWTEACDQGSWPSGVDLGRAISTLQDNATVRPVIHPAVARLNGTPSSSSLNSSMNSAASQSPVTIPSTNASIESDEESDEYSSSDDEPQPQKKVRGWAQQEHLVRALKRQQQVDPHSIFPEVTSCDLNEIFDLDNIPPPTTKQELRRQRHAKRRINTRSSSAVWSPDGREEIKRYRSAMGFQGSTPIFYNIKKRRDD